MYDKYVKEEKQGPVEVNISPLGKGRRIFIHVIDTLFSFVLTTLFVSLVVFPLSKLITNYDDKQYQFDTLQQQRFDILYNEKILFYNDDSAKKYDYTNCIEYSYDRWLSYYVLDGESLDPSKPEFGRKAENEMLYNYFLNKKDDISLYREVLKECVSDLSYFNISETDISISNEVKEELKLFFTPNESLGEAGEDYYYEISSAYAKALAYVINDCHKINLISNGVSYAETEDAISAIDTYIKWMIVIDCLISYFLAWLVIYIFVPIINKDHRTLGMLILKAYRVGINNCKPISLVETLLTGGSSFAFSIAPIAFSPVFICTLIYMLKLPLISQVCFASFILNCAGLCFVLFNSFNRSLLDIITRTVLVSEQAIDTIDSARGL